MASTFLEGICHLEAGDKDVVLVLAEIAPLALALVAGIRDRALLLPLAVSAWLILGPVMGFRTGWRSLGTFGDPARDVTVVTFNAAAMDTSMN